METSWQFVGNEEFSPNVYYQTPVIAFDPSDVPYVAFPDYSIGGSAAVMKFNGTSWQFVGNDGFSAGQAYGVRSAIDQNGTPYVSYVEDDSSCIVMVKEFNGTSWATVGNTGFTRAPSSWGGGDVAIAVDENDNIFVEFADTAAGDYTSVIRYNGTSWGYLGTEGLPGWDPMGGSMVLDSNGVPYIAYADLTLGY